MDYPVIVFAVQPSDDKEITCVVCGLANVDLEILVDVPYVGRKTWAGLHEKCHHKNHPPAWGKGKLCDSPGWLNRLTSISKKSDRSVLSKDLQECLRELHASRAALDVTNRLLNKIGAYLIDLCQCEGMFEDERPCEPCRLREGKTE